MGNCVMGSQITNALVKLIFRSKDCVRCPQVTKPPVKNVVFID